MIAVRSIAKNISALFSGHAINIVQNLVQVPFFIHSYGKGGYGEWLALSAAVSYLGTLDFGVQTYVNQDLTVRYHSGDMDGFHVQQSTALRLLLSIVASVAIIGLVVFILPVAVWLHMVGKIADAPVISSDVVQWAIYLLALQMLISIPAGYFFGTFMVVGKAYIGGYWSNVKYLLLFLSTVGFVWIHASFKTLALAQLISVAVSMLGALMHLRAIAPDIFPTLRFWDGPSIPRILNQSGYFALLWSSNFLLYQVPLILLQRSVGPVSVTMFSIMRTIFSMTRNQMNSLTQAMGPEITTLYGRKDWPMLSRLYNYSERLIFSLIPIANLGVLYLSPLLLVVWMHWMHGVNVQDLFQPTPYLLCATISIVMSIKEHKYQFQFSTNTHKDLARFTVISYVTLDCLWLILVPRYGVIGLLVGWLVIELCQLFYIVHLNHLFFKSRERLEIKYLVRLLLFSTWLISISVCTLPYVSRLNLLLQGVIAVLICGVIFVVDLPLFHLAEVLRKLKERLKNRSTRPVAEELVQQTLP